MIDRRTALTGIGAAIGVATSAKSYAAIIGANDRIRVATVGVNSRGMAHVAAFTQTPNCIVSHIVDVDSTVLAGRLASIAKRGYPTPKAERDYRRVLDDKAVDVVTIATPDHWHAKMAIDAMDAGHHVYVEKPMSMAPAEGEALIAATARTKRVLQMGNQQRSSTETITLKQMIDAGELGDIYEAQTWYANARKTIGRGQTIAPPANLDWELWQGPRPRGPYRSNLVHYNWHWFWRYGTGEICNNALHEVDIARWLMGVSYPETVSAEGARRFHRDDDWEMYDTLALTLEYSGGRKIRWDGHSCNAVMRYNRGRGVMMLGTKGHVLVDRNGFQLFDLAGKPVREMQVKAGGTSETTGTMGEGALDVLHAGNLTDVIRGRVRNLASPVAEGHISTTTCHLGNMAYRTKTKLKIDPTTGKPSDRAAMKLWALDYQPGWEVKG